MDNPTYNRLTPEEQYVIEAKGTEPPFTGQRGWVDSVVLYKPDGADERAFYYQATPQSGK